MGRGGIGRCGAALAVVVVLASCGSDAEPSATADAPAPSVEVPTEATPPSPASTSPADTIETTPGDFDEAPVSCDVFGAVDDDAVAFFAANFQSALVAARVTGFFEFVADCLDAVPAAYTGEFPACWDECGFTRWFVPDFSAPPAERATDGEFWSSGLVVNYDTPEGPVEVVERWEIRAIDDRYEVSGFVVQEP